MTSPAYDWPLPWGRERLTGVHETAGAKCRPRSVRDNLYLNTFCPKENQHVFTKSKSPVKSAPSLARARSFTVTDTRANSRSESFSRAITANNQQETRGIMTASAGHSPINRRFTFDDTSEQKQQKGEASEQTEQLEGTDKVHSGSQHSGLLKVVTSRCGHQDQRDCLRGPEGCLHSRVRQCIRFMKNRERMARNSEWCWGTDSDKLLPFASRMYVITRVTSPPPPYPVPPATDVYKRCMDAIALQTHRDSVTAHRRKRVV